MIDMYDESPAHSGSVKSAKFGLALAAIGAFLSLLLPFLLLDSVFDLLYIMRDPENVSSMVSMMIVGAIMMIVGFFIARRPFEDQDNRNGLMTMAILMIIYLAVFSYIQWKIWEIEDARSSFGNFMAFVGNPGASYENIFRFAVISCIILAVVFFGLASGFYKLKTWSNLRGINLAYIGSIVLGCFYVLLLLGIYSEESNPYGSYGQNGGIILDLIEISPFVGSLLLIAGLLGAVALDCPQLEGDIEEDVYPSSVGAMAYEAASANVPQTPVTNPWTSMTSADLLGVLTNHASYTRPELEEAAIELYKRHDEHYLSAFRAMDSTALEAIIKSPASHLHAEVLAAADALANR